MLFVNNRNVKFLLLCVVLVLAFTSFDKAIILRLSLHASSSSLLAKNRFPGEKTLFIYLHPFTF